MYHIVLVYVCVSHSNLTVHSATCMPLPLAAVKEISDLLNTGLDEETLKVCVQLLEAGVNPEALAAVVRELHRETAALRVSGCVKCMVIVCIYLEMVLF